MTKFKTKNIILATIACLLALISAIFVLAACGETEKPNPDAVVKDDFTWEETEEIWNKMLENITTADRISASSFVVDESGDLQEEGTIKIATDDIFYIKSSYEQSSFEEWIVMEEGKLTYYQINTNSGEKTTRKFTQGEEFNKALLVAPSISQFSKEVLKGVEQYGDGSYLITITDELRSNQEDTPQSMICEFKLNENMQLVQVTVTVNDKVEGVEIYTYGFNAETIPTRPSNVEWGSN